MGKKNKTENQRELTKKERKLLEERQNDQQNEIEDALIKQGRLKTRVRYERKSFLGSVIAISLAFLFGIIAGLGGLVGGIYFVGKKFSVKNVMETVGMDYTAYVEEAYAEMSVIDLLQEIIEEIQGTESLSLNTLGKYSPFVKTQVQNVADILGDAGIKLEVDGLMATPFSDLGTYFQEEVVQKIELGGVLGVTAESDGMMIALCYGKEGVDYDLVDGEIVSRSTSENYPLTVGILTDRATDVIYDMELGTMLGVTPDNDKMMISLCYGKEGVDYTVNSATGKFTQVEGGKEPTTIQDLIDGPTDLIGGLEVETILNIDAESSATMRYLAYGSEAEKDSDGNYLVDEHGNVSTGHYYISTVGGQKTVVMCLDPETNVPYEKRTIDDMKNDDLIEDAAISDLITIDENSSGLMRAIGNWKIGDMKDQSKIESLSVGDVMEISPDATGLMAAIKDWTIGNLKQQHRIERLKVSDVIMQGDNPSNLFNAIGDWRIKDLTSQEKIDTLTLSSILEINDDSPQILKALSETSLGYFNDAVKTLPLKDFLGDDLDDNKLLRTLQNSTVETLSEDIKNLSISDVFAEDAYSYATNYQEGARPTGKVSREDVVSYYVADGNEVVKGYFRADGTLVTGEVKYDAQIALDNRGEGAAFHTPYYVEDRVTVKPVYTWMVVNYDTGELEPMTETIANLERHSVSEDEAYVIYAHEDENGETVETRYDLERVTSYTYENGSPLNEADSAKRVYVETADETTSYYIIERVEVFERYYAESDPATTFETAELRFETADGTAVTRYLGGLWYLLLGEGADAAENTKILDIGQKMATAITTINHMTLGEMYVHEILDTNPDVDISRIPNRGTEKENLSELTIAGVIELITTIANA